MGYTSETIHRVEHIISTHGIRTVVDLGAQNNYSQPHLPAPYMSEWYLNRNIDYVAIDINGENGSLPLNLAMPLPDDIGQFDMLVDAGTSEHVGVDGAFSKWAIFQCWKNKHELVKPGGFMICENPKTGNWPGHGFNYYTEEFYTRLAKYCNYEILELGQHPAMGNVTDGWNIHCIIRKREDNLFMSIGDFEKCEIQTK